MPNTREKLEVIAHLGNHITYKEGIGICYDSALAKVIEDAYMTLKNGVTVQKWIPVTERLPEQTDPATAVLGITQKGRSHIVYYYKGVTNDMFTGFYDNAMKVAVTHWMPLPEPPKGE